MSATTTKKIRFCGSTIECTNEYNYLGVIFRYNNKVNGTFDSRRVNQVGGVRVSRPPGFKGGVCISYDPPDFEIIPLKKRTSIFIDP